MTKSSLLNFDTDEVISRRCKDHNLRKEAAHDGSRRTEAWKLDLESPPLESSGKHCTAAADAQRIGARPLGLGYEVTELGRTSRNRSLPCIAMASDSGDTQAAQAIFDQREGRHVDAIQMLAGTTTRAGRHLRQTFGPNKKQAAGRAVAPRVSSKAGRLQGRW
jgi:hypothetical protein